ncbi:MAG TPA: UDP-N-acetylmuramate dehydrogenase [Acidimicrobiales bacterium]|nr:UDP-N-acetylmuramate dehydrogenase [Acidimicrobiales bacterium]
MADSDGDSDGRAADTAAAVAAAMKVLSDLGDRVIPDGDLGSMTTYRVGGRAALVATMRSVDELGLIKDALVASGLPVVVIGRGSNMLVSDRGFAGLALVLDPGCFSDVEVAGTGVRAGAALPLPALARQTVEAGLTGLEWAVGVPGSVGGGVRMNAGGHGSDIAHHLESATVVDVLAGAIPEELALESMRFAYRRSSVTPHHVVVAATFRLEPGDPEQGRETIREIVRWRREHQPGGQNAGSVFTNPPGTSAGWLIDSAGLKGRRVRSAEVSPKHANFIQADPGGSADDVNELIVLIRDEVRRVHGIDLHAEVRLVGFSSSSSRGLG